MLIQLSHYISNISGLLEKFYFPVEVVLNFLQAQRDLEVVFRPQFLMKLLCLRPLLFSKMNFLFYAQAFDDVMKFENVEF